MPTLQERLDKLVAINNMIQSEVFQEFIARPMTEEKNKRVRGPANYFNETLKESWRKGGQLEGIELYMKLIENIHLDLKDALREIEHSEREQ